MRVTPAAAEDDTLLKPPSSSLPPIPPACQARQQSSAGASASSGLGNSLFPYLSPLCTGTGTLCAPGAGTAGSPRVQKDKRPIMSQITSATLTSPD